jgi:hypothetical protein
MKANPEGEEHLLEEYFADFTQWAENFVGTDPENVCFFKLKGTFYSINFHLLD